MDRPPSARDNNGPASMVEREGRARGGTARGGKVRFGDSTALQLTPLHRREMYQFRRVFLPCADFLRFVPTHPSPGNYNINRNNSSSQQQSVRSVAAIPMACWDFSVCDMFWDEMGGGLT